MPCSQKCARILCLWCRCESFISQSTARLHRRWPPHTQRSKHTRKSRSAPCLGDWGLMRKEFKPIVLVQNPIRVKIESASGRTRINLTTKVHKKQQHVHDESRPHTPVYGRQRQRLRSLRLSRISSSMQKSGSHLPEPWQTWHVVQYGDDGGSHHPPCPSHSSQVSSVHRAIYDSQVLESERAILAKINKAETVVPLVVPHIVRGQIA